MGRPLVLDRYVLDFFIPHLQLAIEIDGKFAHDGQVEKDEERQVNIESTGICFVRIPARWVLRDTNEVVAVIMSLCSGEITIDDLDASLKWAILTTSPGQDALLRRAGA